MLRNKLGFSLHEICIIILITALTTSLTTGIIMYNNNNYALSDDENLQEFLKVYATLDDDYYENVDKSGMIDSAIEAMMNYLGEDYSTYMNQDEKEVLNNSLKGTYNGIGISVVDNNKIFKVHQNTPASQVGLMENDIILEVNGEAVDANSNVASMLKQTEENSLKISRGEEILEFKVMPAEINTPLSREIKERNGKRIGYIYIPSFTATVGEEFKIALNEIESQTIDSLIIDVRSNTGGYLSGATDIATMFLEKDKVMYALEDKDKRNTFKDDTKEKRDYPVIVLINETTASASEVLAAALKDSYGATLVGTNSFGKGKVQQTKNLEDGGMVKYTTARWFTPNGECIDEFGLLPDYSVPLDNDSEDFVDTQLEKALELLS